MKSDVNLYALRSKERYAVSEGGRGHSHFCLLLGLLLRDENVIVVTCFCVQQLLPLWPPVALFMSCMSADVG